MNIYAYVCMKESKSFYDIKQSAVEQVIHKKGNDNTKGEDKNIIKPTETNELIYEKHKHTFFYQYDNLYIPKIILDPLDIEIELYCSSAFCYIVAPSFTKILSNILIKTHTGISKEINDLCKSYACESTKVLHENIKKGYANHLKQVEVFMNANYFA
ncbi:conserved protein, unknown function [Hepatocystis sp. ex Piliocolobus tephrosceles]|nr:conserved protein, unknown function [Hepatocystis sp. ex Piliocolobus tephrosceles]